MNLVEQGLLTTAAERNKSLHDKGRPVTEHVDVYYDPVNSKKGSVHASGWRTVYPVEVSASLMYALDDPRASFPKCYRLERIYGVAPEIGASHLGTLERRA